MSVCLLFAAGTFLQVRFASNLSRYHFLDYALHSTTEKKSARMNIRVLFLAAAVNALLELSAITFRHFGFEKYRQDQQAKVFLRFFVFCLSFFSVLFSLDLVIK